MIALIVQIQKFNEAKRPAIPFTLQIESFARDNDMIEEQKLSNRKTNEELSFSRNIHGEDWARMMRTEIKRLVKQKQDSLPKKNECFKNTGFNFALKIDKNTEKNR